MKSVNDFDNKTKINKYEVGDWPPGPQVGDWPPGPQVGDPEPWAYPEKQNMNQCEFGSMGWICPKCGRVNAPWKGTCDCYKSTDAISITNIGTNPYPYWELQSKSYSNTSSAINKTNLGSQNDKSV